MKHPERRGAPRIAQHVPLKVGYHQNEWVTHTKNISATGAYCTVTQYLDPMTRIKVRLELPARRSAAAQVVTGQGVVVRVEPPIPTPRRRSYHIAIFFQEMPARGRAILARYVQEHLKTQAGKHLVVQQ